MVEENKNWIFIGSNGQRTKNNLLNKKCTVYVCTYSECILLCLGQKNCRFSSADLCWVKLTKNHSGAGRLYKYKNYK